MSTNYYLRQPVDKEVINKLFEEAKDNFLSERSYCMYTLQEGLRPFAEIHLGKRASSFTFASHNWKYFKDMKEFKTFLATGKIFDEYGEELTAEEFWELAKTANNPEANHRNVSGWPDHFLIKFNRLWILKGDFS